MKKKKIEALSQKVELLAGLVVATIEEYSAFESNIKQLEGFAFGVNETSSKFRGYIDRHKAEVAGLEKQGKISAGVVSLMNSAADNVLKFVKENAKDADKLHYVRQGEILALKNKAKNLKAQHDAAKVELEQLQAEVETEALALAELESQKKAVVDAENQVERVIEPESIDVVWEEPVAVEEKEEDSHLKKKKSKVRPDKNPRTKVGKAALDLVERRRKATEESSKKRGRKPKS
jgi:hypothetical protein